ncbi:hypothetical protein [Roseibium sediminis]|uniref:hypothetical protein n=1 Tax=Roseibium sediminis TaxID=1775174 RepID=UPI00123D17BC|nr:hypothetical protein [Roseibium sediminis]
MPFGGLSTGIQRKLLEMNRYIIRTGHFGYPQPADDPRLPDTFDYTDGCTRCGIGKRQFAPIRFQKEPKVSNKAFTGLNWVFGQIFVTDMGRKALEDSGISGLRFLSPVIHKTGEPLEHWFQLEPDSDPLPLIRPVDLIAERCERPPEDTVRFLRGINPKWEDGPYCGRIKYQVPTDGNSNARYTLDASALADKSDIVRACEWVGSGGNAFQEIIVSQRFKDVCDRHKLRGLQFLPAELN